MVKNMKGPKDIASVITTKMLAIKNNLEPPACEGYEGPLKFYHSKFARFSLTIYNKKNSGDGKPVVKGNIPAMDMPDIQERTHFIYYKEMESSLKPAETGQDGLSPAYTVRMTSGAAKGKTPAQFLMEDPDKNQGVLTGHYKWLKQNSSNPKYRDGNLKQMEAIMDAGRLFKAGKLSAKTASGAGQFIIYDPGMRPLVNQKREDGKSFVYQIKITWTLGAKYPLEVSITNFYAPVIKKDDGMLNVKASEKADEIRNNISMSAKDWMSALYIIETNMRTFENIYAAKLYKTAFDADKEARESRNRDNQGYQNGSNQNQYGYQGSPNNSYHN